MATIIVDPNAPEDRELRKIPCGCSINMTFVKSRFGICKAAAIIVSILCLISIGAGTNQLCGSYYGGHSGFYESIAGTVLINDIILYVIFAVTLDQMMCFKLLPWHLWHFLSSTVFALLYFIATIIVLVHACGRGGYFAAVFFGAVAWLVEIITVYVSLMNLRREHAPTDNGFLLFLGVRKIDHSQGTTNNAQADYDPVSKDPMMY